MKEKEPSYKIEDEWENFVAKNKIVRKRSDPKKNIFQEVKNLSPKVSQLNRLKSLDSIETSKKIHAKTFIFIRINYYVKSKMYSQLD